MKYYLSMRS